MNKRLLDKVRGRIGEPPRSIGFFRMLKLKGKQPDWMARGELLRQVVRDQPFLLRHGHVVWGALVQANSELFQPGARDLPAFAVYARDQSFDDALNELGSIASRLYRLKNTTPDDPEERRLAALITSEKTRSLSRPVPPSCAGGRQVWSSDLLVFRKHIPGGVLSYNRMPILYHPDANSILIVPQVFWPEELVARWN